uniref:Glyceraldehyde-3-phosphate dehydrogenase n=1 Tax=Solanum tuberosum TaxID=4113 RepID=M1DD89_SOLTU
MASAALSVANSTVHFSNNKGSFSEFTGLRTSSAVPFGVGRKINDDLLSLVAFQTSIIGGGKKNNSRVVEAKLKVAINGFGRIGRNFLSGVKQASHFLKYDSTLGIFDVDVKPVGTDGISVDGKLIKVVSDRNPINLPWKDLGVNLVIEGTKVFVNREGAGKYIQAGAKKVLITAPGKGDIPTYVIGVNADLYSPDEPIINNASCTTNYLAPFVKVLDQKFGNI